MGNGTVHLYDGELLDEEKRHPAQKWMTPYDPSSHSDVVNKQVLQSLQKILQGVMFYCPN